MHLSSWLDSVRNRLHVSRRRQSARPFTRIAERLEDRTLLSVNALFVAGELTVLSNADDSILIHEDPSNTGQVELVVNGSPFAALPPVNADAVTSIVVSGGDQANAIDLTAVLASVFSQSPTIRIEGNNGADTIDGSVDLPNNISGGDGKDSLTGGTANDTIDGGNGGDSIAGGTGNDELTGEDGADSIDGDAGLDTIDGGNGNDTINGGDDNDVINGGDDADTLGGDGGDDVVNGESGTDSVRGGDGNDTLFGGSENDAMFGDDGDDTLDGNGGDDTAQGGAGVDVVMGGSGDDLLFGNDGNDVVNGNMGNDTLDGDNGNDTLLGGGGNDSLLGDNGDDVGKGHSGNDTLDGGGGEDFLDGGTGNDLVRSGGPAAKVQVMIDDVTIDPEGDSGQTAAVLTVSLSAVDVADISVDFTTVDGTAEDQNGDGDYDLASGTVTIPAGQLSTTITVLVNGDTNSEGTENFAVNLTNPSGNAVIVNTQGTVTIVDDDAPSVALYALSPINNSDLYIIDPSTAGATLVGPTGISGIAGMTADAAGVLYTVDFPSNEVSSLDPATGAATTLFTLSPGDTIGEGGLAFDAASGLIYGVDFFNGDLYTIDIVAQTSTNLGSLLSGGAPIGSSVHVDALTFAGSTLYLYIGLLGANGIPADSLLTIDTMTREVTVVGQVGTNHSGTAGMAYDAAADVLYLIVRSPGGVDNDNLYSVDPATGVGTLVGQTGLTVVSGLAYGAVATPFNIGLDYLQDNADDFGLSPSDLSNYIVTDQYVSSHTNVTHVYLQQTHGGLPIADAAINVNVLPSQGVVSAHSSFLPDLGRVVSSDLEPTISAADALVAFADEFGYTLTTSEPEILEQQDDVAQTTLLAASGVSLIDIPAELQWVPDGNGGVELAWLLNIQTVDGEHWYDVSISAVDADVLLPVDWVADATYNALSYNFENPDDGSLALIVNPENATASPFGWHDTNGVAGAEFTDTRGNNVFAQEDRDNNNVGGFRPDGGAGLLFNFPVDFAQDPITYESAAITNLFYTNNILHDIHYQYGFDEVSGNFQENNYGNGGIGGDAVNADAQDGSGFNNANFATPPDGFNPRMQQFIFTITAPRRDSDLANGIIIHEYGHGVSNRLTGGPANSFALFALQSGGMGEGWSDWWSLMFAQELGDGQFDAYPIGNYVLGQPPTAGGIRRFPYSFDTAINPLTYGDFNGGFPNNEVHNAGEIWASALWDMNWLLINGATNSNCLGQDIVGMGFDPDLYNGTGGNNLALQLVMDGLKLQPANPSFLDARDGILQADQILTGGQNELAIWTAFARRGMGFSANDGGSANATTVTEAFDLPPQLGNITLDMLNYSAGQPIGITVCDVDLTGPTVAVNLVTGGGDSETVILNAVMSNPGQYAGSIPTAVALTVTPASGVIELDGEQTFLIASYTDGNNGNNTQVTLTAAANVLGASSDTLFGGTGDDTLEASVGDDYLNGGGGNDILTGDVGNDLLLGGAGTDNLDGGMGDDTLDGQSGEDALSSGDGNDMFLWDGAGDGSDVLTSTSGADIVSVRGNSAANTINIGQLNGEVQVSEGTSVITVASTVARVLVNGGTGGDTIIVNDLTGVSVLELVLEGDLGDDTIDASASALGSVRLSFSGGTGDDTIIGSNDADTIDGGDGNDQLFGGGGNDTIRGGLGDDLLNGQDGADSLLGNDGNDTIMGEDGNDVLVGGLAADSLVGGAGNDTLRGEAGNDFLNGNSGDDSLAAGDGTDVVYGGSGNDTLDGGSSGDYLKGNSGNDKLLGDDGNDTIMGDAGNDTINGGDGDDVLTGGAGDDGIAGKDGNDFINGEAGDDTLVGGEGDDIIFGGAGRDIALGDEGNDRVKGNGGTDTLAGGEGDDTLTGSAGEIDEAFVLSQLVLDALDGL